MVVVGVVLVNGGYLIELIFLLCMCVEVDKIVVKVVKDLIVCDMCKLFCDNVVELVGLGK